MEEQHPLEQSGDLVPVSRVAARFGYRDPRYFRRFAARQKFGLNVVKFNGRYFIPAGDIEAFWRKHRPILQAADKALGL